MKKLWRLIYSNKFFAVITLLMQIAMIAVYIVGVSNNTKYYLLLSNIISAGLIIFEVNRHEETAFKITWIMLIAVIPFLGWFFYIYMHTGVISKNLRIANETAKTYILKYRPDDSDIIHEMDSCHENTSLVKYLSNSEGCSVFKNTKVTYYSLGDDMFKDMMYELEKATKFIFMEFFIINNSSSMWKHVEELLIRKAQQGVDVRLMYDGMGCMNIMPKGYEQVLQSKGIKCQIFSPVQPLLSTYQNNRDHRKVIVIDGKCAFSGGINLADEYINKIVRFGHWKDTGIRLLGEGVAGFTAMFLTMWHTVAGINNDDISYYIKESVKYSYPNEAGYVIPYSDTPLDNKPVGRNAYVDLLNNAKHYVHIMTPYFVIDEAIYDAMSYAVTRGVDVKIILPGIPDKKMPYCLARSYYRDLTAIGVEIYEYIPGFVHAKTTVSDDIRAIVGTVNYDYRSLYLHYECAAYIVDSPEILKMETDVLNTLAKCRRVTRTEYDNFPWYYRFAGRVLRLFATMI